ncbi:MAG TPA: hypothetical protein PLD40_09745 [Kiritimatiellia bacterium]|jgi:hypothetical protein|nr:hypothetical protein [Kiritimatiellia bacterium]HOE37734.1 hypothetical protein [Kiritimatiellia bacterium]HOR75107.1 hypothetical protein [Kiritimatiellia bacterium]HOU59646.1 hypothetical protein [Kiritimatiellia bacterium]HPK70071.1 hypothetical protein [Kiritimatiellia bacterium]
MSGENELKPLDISAIKSSTSRIDLSKATIPTSPATSGIRIGANPKKATSRIDINAIPGATKAQTSRVGLGAMPPADDEAFKRRTALLDTSNIPLATTPAPQPRTIRIGSRPTVRVASTATPSTFSPGRSEEAAPAESSGGRPTIKLKRPGGASSITISGGTTAPSVPSEPMFTIEADEGPGAAWSVISLLSMLVVIGLIVYQVLTLNGAKY